MEEVKAMKEGIHPEYYEATVATAVTHLRPVQQSRIFMWKFVPNAIRSIPDSRKLLQPVDVLRNSIRNTACNLIEACKRKQRVEVAKSQPILL